MFAGFCKDYKTIWRKKVTFRAAIQNLIKYWNATVEQLGEKWISAGLLQVKQFFERFGGVLMDCIN